RFQSDLAQRNPVPCVRIVGTAWNRQAGLTHDGIAPFHAPPRMMRSSPLAGPFGSVVTELAEAGSYSAYQSATHSQTFPTMSAIPQLDRPFGKLPTGAVFGNPSSSSYIAAIGWSGSRFFFIHATHSVPHALSSWALGL